MGWYVLLSLRYSSRLTQPRSVATLGRELERMEEPSNWTLDIRDALSDS